MPRRLRTVFMVVVVPFGAALAQQPAAPVAPRVLRISGDDGLPVAFANVTLQGERVRIANERGEVDLPAAAPRAVSADVRRLGYEPFFGPIAAADSSGVATLTLHRISRRLFTVKVIDSSAMIPAYLRGFYERMLARQRGIGTGLYLTPEEIDKRSASATSALLNGLNGVSLGHTASGKTIAMSASGQCEMSVMVDGHRVCPQSGCDRGVQAPDPTTAPAPSGTGRRRAAAAPHPPSDDQYVLIDNLLSVTDVAAIEVYARGATIPASLSASDASCGVVAIWTGARKAP